MITKAWSPEQIRYSCPVCGTSAPTLATKKRHIRQAHGRKVKRR